MRAAWEPAKASSMCRHPFPRKKLIGKQDGMFPDAAYHVDTCRCRAQPTIEFCGGCVGCLQQTPTNIMDCWIQMGEPCFTMHGSHVIGKISPLRQLHAEPICELFSQCIAHICNRQWVVSVSQFGDQGCRMSVGNRVSRGMRTQHLKCEYHWKERGRSLATFTESTVYAGEARMPTVVGRTMGYWAQGGGPECAELTTWE